MFFLSSLYIAKILQLTPFSVKAVGAVKLLLAVVAGKPRLVLRPAWVWALGLALFGFTPSPVWGAVVFQDVGICWSPGQVKTRVQPLIVVVPGLLICMLAMKFPDQLEETL